MNFEVATATLSASQRDSDVIRVDFADDKLGIAAALRQAFASAAQDQCTRDFEKLLAELD